MDILIPMENRDVIFEYTPVGNMVRITAMDTKTLTEIIISCPAGTPDPVMKQNALKRLEFVLRKKGIIR